MANKHSAHLPRNHQPQRRRLHPLLDPDPFQYLCEDTEDTEDPDAICWTIPPQAWQEFQVERALQEADSWDRK